MLIGLNMSWVAKHIKWGFPPKLKQIEARGNEKV